jgi:[NiFe] hydrogenase assembly HybE family chaperone
MGNSAAARLIESGPLLEKVYRNIQCERMLGLPILNPDLAVEAVGFMPFRGHSLGILITPWFMSLMLLPGTVPWPALREGESQSWQFPCGVLTFVAESEIELGSYQTCSLFSPMHEFSGQAEARAAAHAVLDGLFTPAVSVEPAQVPAQPVGPLAEMREAIAAPMSKRDFLRGCFLPGRQREPRG